MPGYALLRQLVLTIATTLAALILLVQPAASEMEVPPLLGIKVDSTPSVMKDPSQGSLCVCAVIAGYSPDYGERQAEKLYAFLRDGRNSCHWQAQQEVLHEWQNCIVEVHTYFTFAERCTEHAWSLNGRRTAINSRCLLLTPQQQSLFPEY